MAPTSADGGDVDGTDGGAEGVVDCGDDGGGSGGGGGGKISVNICKYP